MPHINESKKGLLIAFDGLDSSGKATQVRELVRRLSNHGHRVHQFQTPDYDTPSGRELQLRLQGKMGDWQSTRWEEKMKYFADNRTEHKAEVMAALHAGDIVVYDRYVVSSLAFITIEALVPQETDLYRAKVHATVKREEYVKNGMPKEHVSVFLDVPPAIALNLLEERKMTQQQADEYTDHLVVQQRLYNEYDYMATQDPRHFLRVRCVEGPQLLSIADVAEYVWAGLHERFVELHFPSLIRRGKGEVES